MINLKKILLLICCVLLSWNAGAMEVSGVKLADSVHVGNRDLVLNGAGLRTWFFFKVYVAALYLDAKTHDAEAALNRPGEKRMEMHMLRELSDEKMLHAFDEAISANQTPAQMQALAPQMQQLTGIFHEIGEVRDGDVVVLDYLPDRGTQIMLNGTLKGTIPGADFNHALLMVWLGDKPAQADLKQELLGLQ